MTHPAVLECAITAVPHPERGQVVKATIVLTRNRGYEPSEELKRELQEHVKAVNRALQVSPHHRFCGRAAQDRQRQDTAQAHPQPGRGKARAHERVNVICLGVRDMAASVRFYRDGLGFQTTETEDAPEVIFFNSRG